MKVQLGWKVRDSLTGFEGIAIGRTEWLHGCDHIGVKPQGVTDGKPADTQWFDEPRLEVVEKIDPAKWGVAPEVTEERAQDREPVQPRRGGPKDNTPEPTARR